MTLIGILLSCTGEKVKSNKRDNRELSNIIEQSPVIEKLKEEKPKKPTLKAKPVARIRSLQKSFLEDLSLSDLEEAINNGNDIDDAIMRLIYSSIREVEGDEVKYDNAKRVLDSIDISQVDVKSKSKLLELYVAMGDLDKVNTILSEIDVNETLEIAEKEAEDLKNKMRQKDEADINVTVSKYGSFESLNDIFHLKGTESFYKIPLINAIEKGYVDIARALLDKGAYLNVSLYSPGHLYTALTSILTSTKVSEEDREEILGIILEKLLRDGLKKTNILGIIKSIYKDIASEDIKILDNGELFERVKFTKIEEITSDIEDRISVIDNLHKEGLISEEQRGLLVAP